jgi:cytidine deaminase
MFEKEIQIAKEYARKSYSPYSNFKVAACLTTVSGKLFAGCNVENASYGGCICAEQTALVKAVSEGELSFARLVVYASHQGRGVVPCGICLQVLSEFFSGDEEVVIVNAADDAINAVMKFKDLFPHNFKFSK